MRLHLLVTPKQRSLVPASIKITSFANISVLFADEIVEGDNCMVEGEEKEVKEWLEKCKVAYVGDGNVMMESFERRVYA